MKFHKYTISKKGFFRKSFEIYCDDLLVYKVSCPGWFSYSHLVFKNTSGEEVLLIEKVMFQMQFEFIAKGRLKAKLNKAIFSNEYSLKSDVATYEAKGNWMGNEYTIFLGEDDIAKVSRTMWSDKNQYGIAIIEGNHNLFILGMIVTIEIIKMINHGNG